LTTQIKENIGDQTVLLLGCCHELPERESCTLFEQAPGFVCSLMQKWTFANADPGFKTQDELSLQLFSRPVVRHSRYILTFCWEKLSPLPCVCFYFSLLLTTTEYIELAGGQVQQKKKCLKFEEEQLYA